MKNKETIKIAFLGNTGVGKDTCVSIILKNFSSLSIRVLRLADPFYKVQNYIYELCRKEKGETLQDGILLNFLGEHMRKINSDVLKQYFYENLKQLQGLYNLIICCDARPLDVQYLKESGFIIVRITAHPNLTLERRKTRGDPSLGNSLHPTEKGIAPSLYDFHIKNNGTFEELREKLLILMRRFGL